ncbi:MAG: hypothetical protein PSX80_08835 [bacterium]|nr:hypothetical protein [bacterium]
MKELVLTLVVITLGWASVPGCILAGKSTTKFDPDEFVFIGKVIGYTDAVPYDHKRANGSVDPVSSKSVASQPRTDYVNYGLIVEATESVHLPTKAATFEIFEYWLRADCLITGVSKNHFPDKFPIGSEVRIISRKAEFVVAGSNGHARLENKLDEDHDIATNTLNDGTRATSANSVFDYSAHSYVDGRDSIDKYLLPAFELRKDLLRLSKAKTEQEKHLILDRIYGYKSGSSIYIEHGGIFKDNTSSEAEYRKYYYRFLKERDPELFQQVTAYHDALDRLLSKGYGMKEAEEAIGKAFQAGTDIEAVKLYEASLKFLPKPKK